MGERPARRRPDALRAAAPLVVRGGRAEGAAAVARGQEDRLGRRRRAEGRREERSGHARRDHHADCVRALPRAQRRHVELARGFRGATLRPPLRRGRAARVGRPAARALECGRGGVRVLQQQQPDERRRAGAGRRAAAAQAARGGERPDGLMRVLAVTHGPDVRPEVFADVILEDGHELVEWDIRAQSAPFSSEYDAVIVLGGDQNVGEELEHPWLHEEYDVLRRWVSDGTPLLGICLGAQTLAHALGATVDRVPPAPLAGFYETVLTPAGRDDPVLGVLPRRFEAMNANAYRFALPPDAVELARGPVPQ